MEIMNNNTEYIQKLINGHMFQTSVFRAFNNF